FVKVPASAFTPAYTGALIGGTQNPHRGNPAWVGTSPSYPQMLLQNVDLGTTYAGKKVRIAWVIGVDSNATGPGWELDDIKITGLAPGKDKPWRDLDVEAGACLNRPPVANAGPDFAADERGPVVLDPSRTVDPDPADTLTFTWAQTSGPMVTLDGGMFIAPEVTADTPATFTLTASDGTLSSMDDVTVTIRQVNRPPVITAATGPRVVYLGDMGKLTA